MLIIAVQRARKNPRSILEIVKSDDNQNSPSPRRVISLMTTLQGDGRKSSSPMRTDAAAHTAIQKRTAAVRNALDDSVEIFKRSLASYC